MRISTNILFIWFFSTLAMTGCSIPGMDKNTSSAVIIEDPIAQKCAVIAADLDAINKASSGIIIDQTISTQSGIIDGSIAQKCPIRTTHFGSISGTGGGVYADTGSQVKVEYALYDTCGTSIQGTREERLAFDAVVWKGTIPGFAQAMMCMQAGQTREFALSPKDAYGEEFIEIPMTREMVQGTIVQPVTRELLEGIFIHPIDSKIYTENKPITQSLGGPVDTTKIQVGSVYPSSVDPNLLMKVTAIDGDKVTYVLDTSKLPFYNKPIVVGTKASQDGVDYEIVSMSGSVMMVSKKDPSNALFKKDEIKNGAKTSKDGVDYEIISMSWSNIMISQKMPYAAIFMDSEIKIGAKKKLTEKSLSFFERFGLKIGDEVEIADILWNGEEVVLSLPNKQDHAGKSLVFSIKMVSVAK